MSEATINAIDLDVHVRITTSTYKGEEWYTAQGGFQGFADIAHGRTPGRAAGFLLQKLAEPLLKKDITVAAPEPGGVSAEIVDVSPVYVGVDWGNGKDHSAIVIAKRQADGSVQVLASQTTPPSPPWPTCPRCDGSGVDPKQDMALTKLCVNCHGCGKVRYGSIEGEADG